MDSDSWPYLETNHGSESDAHRELKNLAIFYLLQRGYSIDDIEDEHYVSGQRGSYGHADLFADDGSVQTYVECKEPHATVGNIGGAGQIAAKNGENVLVFDREGIHRLEYKEVDITFNAIDDSAEPLIDRPDTGMRLKLKRISDLPLLDLRAYKE